MHRVVITGMGAVSCLGESLEEISRSLQEGRSGAIFSPNLTVLGCMPMKYVVAGIWLSMKSVNMESVGMWVE